MDVELAVRIYDLLCQKWEIQARTDLDAFEKAVQIDIIRLEIENLRGE